MVAPSGQIVSMTGLPEGPATPEAVDVPEYTQTLTDIVGLLDQARAAAARSVNALMTATYWGIGRRIVVTEQQGQGRAEYGRTLIARLSVDLTSRFGRGFSETNLRQFRSFFLCWQTPEIWPTVSAKSELNDAARGNSQLTGCVDEERISNREIQQTVSAEFELSDITSRNGLPLGTARVREISDSEILPTLSSEFKLSDVIRGNVLQAGLSDISKDEMMPTVPAQPIIEVATSKNVQAVPLTVIDMPDLATLASAFPLPWSAYVRLLSVKTVWGPLAAPRLEVSVEGATMGTATQTPATKPIPVTDLVDFEAERIGHSGQAIHDMGVADGGLAMAGHVVTDPVLRQISWDAAEGIISTDEAVRRSMEHITAKHRQ